MGASSIGVGVVAVAGIGVVSRPDSASARAMIASAPSDVVTPPSISSTSCGMNATASRTTATISGDRVNVWLITRFSSVSMLHENSPTRRAPTMRPLPFSV